MSALANVLPIQRHEVTVRNMRFGESVPTELELVHGFVLDYAWVWVLEVRGKVLGALYVAPAHGIAILMRVCLLPTAPSWSLGRLLRKMLEDIDKRGYKGYAVCLDPDRPEEQKLLRVVARAKGKIFGKGVIVGGMADYRNFAPIGEL